MLCYVKQSQSFFSASKVWTNIVTRSNTHMNTHICECIAQSERVCAFFYFAFFSVFFLSLLILSFCSPMLMNSAYWTKQKKRERKKRKENKWFPSECVCACEWASVFVCSCVSTSGWFLLVFVIFFSIIFVICLCRCEHFIIFVVCCNRYETISYKHTQRSCVTDSSRTTLSIQSVSFYLTWTLYLLLPLYWCLSVWILISFLAFAPRGLSLSFGLCSYLIVFCFTVLFHETHNVCCVLYIHTHM